MGVHYYLIDQLVGWQYEWTEQLMGAHYELNQQLVGAIGNKNDVTSLCSNDSHYVGQKLG